MSTTVSFFTPVQTDITAVEALMRSQADEYHSDLRAALDLILKSGGKRIRPSLTLLIGNMLGAPRERLITLAAAIELLHTATLVHDDLIDGSLLRRGMPTLNSQWSPGATVLTGDFLFACAARLAADTNSIPVMQIFSKTLTIIVNGEVSQLFASRCQIDRKGYHQRIYAKTASLFETAATAAALISPVDEKVASKLGSFGYEIGVAFQIIDDILDFTGDQSTVGKPVGNDLRQGIVTLPTINFCTNHPDNPNAKLLTAGICLNDNQVEEMIAAIRESDAIQTSHSEAVQYIERGLRTMESFPDCVERQSLMSMANFIVQREI